MPTFNAYTGDLYIDDGGHWNWTPLHIATNTATATATAEEIVTNANTAIENEVLDASVFGKYEPCYKGQRCEGDECQEETMELQEVLGF